VGIVCFNLCSFGVWKKGHVGWKRRREEEEIVYVKGISKYDRCEEV
jgi:hypothetical protein